MFLSKRDGIFYLFYKQKSGKRTCISTGTRQKHEAINFLRNFVPDYVKKEEIAKTTSLRKFINLYVDYSKTRNSHKTTMDLISTFKYFLIFIGDVPIESITQMNIEKYIQERHKKSVHTSSKDLRYLKSSFNWAVDRGLLEDSPCRKIKNIKRPESQPLFFSKEEFETLLDHIEGQIFKDIVIFAVYTGLRQGEILNLRWDQVYIERKMILLSNQYTLTKSRRIKSLPLCNNAFEVIQRRIGISNEFVFTKDGIPILARYLRTKYRNSVLESGINPKLKFHSLRHTFASWLVQKGVSIYEVSKLLGHSDIKTTEIYAHLSTENLAGAIKALD